MDILNFSGNHNPLPQLFHSKSGARVTVRPSFAGHTHLTVVLYMFNDVKGMGFPTPDPVAETNEEGGHSFLTYIYLPQA